MPQPKKVTAVAEEAVARLDRAWARVETAQSALLAAVGAGRTAGLARLLRQLAAAADAVQRLMPAVAEDLARVGVPTAYAEGAAAAGGLFAWDDAHIATVTRLAQDTYDDLLAASRRVGQTSARLQRLVRAAAASRIPEGVRLGKSPAEIGREVAKDLAKAGVSAVTYSDGSRHGVREYADVVARAKVATAYNAGTLYQSARAGVDLVEVNDGIGCGVRSHTDPEKAAGQVWTLQEAAANPISHPRCQRSFTPVRAA